MRISRIQATMASLLTIGAAIGLTFATTASASVSPAVSALPAGTQACASGQVKLDYQYGGNAAAVSPASFPWSDVCGTGTWTWSPFDAIYTIRMPTAPHHRVWLHEHANGSGWAVCFYSTGQNVSIPSAYWLPGNIQVSANTAPC